MKRAVCFSLLVVFVTIICLPYSASALSEEGALDFTSARAPSRGEGWSWDKGSKTLTLNGLNLNARVVSARLFPSAICLPGGSTIVLTDGSENSVINSANCSGKSNSCAIYSAGSLTITGGGRLTVSNTGISSGCFGIYAAAELNIVSGADVRVEGGESSTSGEFFSAAVFAGNSLTVSGASLAAACLAKDRLSDSFGIYALGAVEFLDAAVSASGGEALSKSCGVMCGAELQVIGGSLAASGGGSGGVSAGVCVLGTAAGISGGADVTASGGVSPLSAGILAENGLIGISGEDTVVEATGGASTEGTRSLSGTADAARLSGGLCGGGVDISGGRVFAGAGSGCGGAISSSGSVSVSAGEITSISNGKGGVFSISGLNGDSEPGNFVVSGGSFNGSVAEHAADNLNFEVDRGDGRFSYFASAEEALAYAGCGSGAAIVGVGASAGLRSCSVTVSLDGEGVDFTRVMPEGFTLTLPEAQAKCGYMFLGWTDGQCSYSSGETVTISRSSDFVPVWGSLPSVAEPGCEQEDPEMPAAEFADVSEDAWYFDAVQYVSAEGLMRGVDDENFAPEAELSRAMFWTVLARAEGVDTFGGSVWYACAQEWAAAAGVSDGEEPGASITREQLVTMLYRLYGEESRTARLEEISDADSVSSWAREALAWAVGLKLIEGDENGSICPASTATRAQAAVILMRLAQI